MSVVVSRVYREWDERVTIDGLLVKEEVKKKKLCVNSLFAVGIFYFFRRFNETCFFFSTFHFVLLHKISLLRRKRRRAIIDEWVEIDRKELKLLSLLLSALAKLAHDIRSF